MEVTESELSSLGLAIAVGDSIMGTFSYDTSNATADGFPGNPNQGSYGFDVPPSSMSYTVGGYNYVAEDKQLGGFFPFPTNPESVVSVINDIGGRDILSVSSAATIGTTDVETNIRLFDFTENVFSDDSLPTAFSGQDFDLSFIATCSQCSRLTFSRVQDNFGFTDFRAQLDTLNAVPIPAAIWLFGTALIGLLGFSKRRKAA